MTQLYTPQPTLILLLLEQTLAAWEAFPDDIPRNLKIMGEYGWTPCSSPEQLVRGLIDLREQIGSKINAAYHLELLYATDDCPLLTSALPQLTLTKCSWQVQRWEALLARSEQPQGGTVKPTCDWIAERVLPLLLVSDDGSTREQLQEATQREHANLTDQLLAERSKLQRDNAALQAQNTALRCVDAERLIVYLPALYPRVFTEIGGHDLAVLTGRPEPYALPNPYPEPSPETLLTLQRDYRALPRELQRQIVGFIGRLPQGQRLKPRPEMRELVIQLESE